MESVAYVVTLYHQQIPLDFFSSPKYSDWNGMGWVELISTIIYKV